MTRALLVAATASHAGKSTVVAGLCRRLANRGVSVAPFKAQNMSNNARAALRAGTVDSGDVDAAAAGGTDESDSDTGAADTGTADTGATDHGAWGEIGVSQYVQARAARVTPTTDMNPVLLKPRGDGESQLVVGGEPVADVAAGEYYDSHWERAREAAREAYERVAAAHDVVVCEGAGSLAEINLHHRDLANVETARFADADVLVLGDIERGGVFASLYGTLELAPGDVRERVVGTAITKFRGDASLLDPGIEELESRTGVPVVAVLPYADPGLPAEDSLALPTEGTGAVRSDDDGVSDDRAVRIAVPRLPKISNFTDLEPLAAEPGVRVAYVPLGADLDGFDAVVVPGSKNTVDDLLALREAGFDDHLRAFDGPVVGLCGGYQLLGERLTGAALEGTGDADVVDGVGLLPVETRFAPDKRVRETTREVRGVGPIAGASGTVAGYEIHHGRTTALADVARPLGPSSAAVDDVLGTYLHGLFENDGVREAFVAGLFERAGRARPDASATPDPYERAADLVAPLDGLVR